jgi:hypothetical protein
MQPDRSKRRGSGSSTSSPAAAQPGRHLEKCSLRGAGGRLENRSAGQPLRQRHAAAGQTHGAAERVCATFLATRWTSSSPPAARQDEPSTRNANATTLVQQALNHPLIADAIEIFNGKLVDVQILPEVNK